MFAVLHTPGAFPRGEGGSRRLTDEVPPGEKPCGMDLRRSYAMCSEEKAANFVHNTLKIVQSFLCARWFYGCLLFV
jgi:hypothetical protein